MTSSSSSGRVSKAAFWVGWVLTVLPSDKRIELGLNDEVSPGVLRSVDDADYCYIVMPMRL